MKSSITLNGGESPIWMGLLREIHSWNGLSFFLSFLFLGLRRLVCKDCLINYSNNGFIKDSESSSEKKQEKKKDLLIEGTVESINNLLDFNNGRVEIS